MEGEIQTLTEEILPGKAFIRFTWVEAKAKKYPRFNNEINETTMKNSFSGVGNAPTNVGEVVSMLVVPV